MASGFPSGQVAVVGVYESPRRKAPDTHPYRIHAEVVAGALADAGLEPGDVDGFASVASFPPEAGWQLELVEICEFLGLRPRWFDSTDTGGAAFLTHAGHAALAISAGLCDVVVVSYAACGRSGPLPFPDYNTGRYGPGAYEVPFGPTTVASYALAARRHMDEFGTTPEQLARIAVACRANAEHNPDARYRSPLTVDEVVSSPLIADPLRRLDCCVVTDSGAAFVLASREVARRIGRDGIVVRGFGEALGYAQMSQFPDLTVTASVESGSRAFESAGMSVGDIDCAQLYDSFTITVALALEDLGFAPKGQVGRFIDDGGLDRDHGLAINTDGGGLSSNHPGRRGALAVVEAVRQLRGTSPGVNLPAPRNCLVHGIGGSLSAAATLILDRES